MAKPKLRDFAKNIHSQFGEDGIIEKIFSIIGTTTKSCAEFGAWDGFHLSNTANLFTNGWKGTLIEGNAERFQTLLKNTGKYGCVGIQCYVGTDPNRDSLEFLLKSKNVDFAVDLLSIDIDSNDYYIFESLKSLKPRVIICEFNPTIPYFMDIYGKTDAYMGCSLGSLNRLAESKGYKLVAVTETNGIFVLADLFSKFSEYETNIHELAITKYYNFIITNHGGHYLTSGEFAYGLRDPIKKSDIVGPDAATVTWRDDLRIVPAEWIGYFIGRAKSLIRTGKRIIT